MVLVSYRDATEQGEPHPDCCQSLVERCLPSLTMLDECGIDCFTASFRVMHGSVLYHWLDEPYFRAITSLPRKHQASATKALDQVFYVLDEAISAAFDEADGMDDLDGSALLYVTVAKRPSSSWWIHCEVVAIVAEDDPGLALRLH